MIQETSAGAAQIDTLTEVAAGGADTIDFGAINTDSMLSLSFFETQAVHTNRSLLLRGAGQFERAHAERLDCRMVFRAPRPDSRVRFP